MMRLDDMGALVAILMKFDALAKANPVRIQ